jgi:beta-N-acetylhexosaminidase
MGAIAKHCEIEEASVKAFQAGEDMLLICATPETIRRGYRALLEAGRTKELTEKRMQASLKRIAATKALAQPPLPLDMERFDQLANDIRQLNQRLEYVYPGESNVQ